MKDTPFYAILLVVGASILGAAGQFLFKSGSEKPGFGILTFVSTPAVVAGMACYIAVMVMFTTAFRLGGSVRVLYPIYATTFIWAALAAWAMNHDPIRPIHVGGMMLLLGGITCMSS